MSIHTDKAIDSTEQSMKEVATRGPRAKYFFCIAWKQKLFEVIEAGTSEEAEVLFGEMHEGVKPNHVEGGQGMKDVGGGSGYYLAKGTGMSDAQRISVTVSAEQMTNHTNMRIKGEFRGWIVYGNGIHGFKTESAEFKDNDLVMIMFDSPVDKNNKVPKPKMKKHEAVRKDDIKILSESAA